MIRPARKPGAAQIAVPSFKAVTPTNQPEGLRRTLAKPDLAAPAELLALQRTVGNRAVQRLLSASRPRPAQPAAAAPARQAPNPSPSPNDPGHLAGGPVTASIESAIQRASGDGRSLDRDVRGSMEQSLGTNFSRVRVHTDARADQLNRSLSAKAFTVGSDIFFRQGTYAPASSSGKHLLAHELTHVMQQGGGKTNSAVQAKLMVGPARDRYEAEADHMAGKIMATRPGQVSSSLQPTAFIRRTPAIQRTVVVNGTQLTNDNVTKNGVKLGDEEVSFVNSAKNENISRNLLRLWVKDKDKIFSTASAQNLMKYLDDEGTHGELATVTDLSKPPAVSEPPQEEGEQGKQSKVTGKWWKWPLSILAMVPGIGGAIAGAKAGYKAGKGGAKGVGMGIGGGILGALGGLLAPVVGAVAGAGLGAKGGAQAVWNKLMRGKKWYHGIYSWLPALLGGAAGAVGGSLMGLAATTAALGPMAVDDEMVDEDLGRNEQVETAKQTKLRSNQLQRGDIVLVHGGGGMSGGLIKFGQFFHQMWSGQSRRAGTGYRHAGIVVGSGMYAHVTNAGSRQDPIEPGLVIFRPSSAELGARAAAVAEKWSDELGKIKYSKSKAAGTMFGSSAFSKSQAAILAAYYKKGIAPESMLCSEFAIAVYQAAALKPAIDQLNSESFGKVEDDDRKGTKKWAKDNKWRLDVPENMLKLDPRRTSPQMLAAELTKLQDGTNPQWRLIGVSA